MPMGWLFVEQESPGGIQSETRAGAHSPLSLTLVFGGKWVINMFFLLFLPSLQSLYISFPVFNATKSTIVRYRAA